MKIQTIKTSDGYFIKDATNYRSNIPALRFKEEEPKKTWKSDWFKVKDINVEIKERIPSKNEYLGYKLKEEFKENKNIPKYVKYENRCDVFGEDLDEGYINLYEMEFKKNPDSLVDIDIEFENVGEVTGEIVEKKIEYDVYGEWNKKWKITNKKLKRCIIDEIITPSILDTEVPVKLSSKESFDIIRAYIKDNINPKHAEITSDYRFCLTVKKRVQLAEEESYTIDVNNSIFNKRRRKPKFVSKTRRERSFTAFETAPESYQDYTVTKPFTGKNVDDLKKNIDKYLKELITYINKPLVDCSNCNGCGVIDEK